MPQENLNHIYNAGKYFEPKPEQKTEPSPVEPKPSTVKRKINVAKAFMPEQEDPFKQKVEAVLKGIEPTSAPAAAGEEEKSVPSDAEVIVGTRQSNIGRKLVVGKSIHVEGNAGDWLGSAVSGGEIQVEGNAGDFTGDNMSGGEIYIKGSAGSFAGYRMSGGTLRIDGDVVSFDESAFTPDNKGTIIWKGETIWENGQKVEPGWTNLNVEGKIAK